MVVVARHLGRGDASALTSPVVVVVPVVDLAVKRGEEGSGSAAGGQGRVLPMQRTGFCAWLGSWCLLQKLTCRLWHVT